jgi:hypothetical protein
MSAHDGIDRQATPADPDPLAERLLEAVKAAMLASGFVPGAAMTGEVLDSLSARIAEALNLAGADGLPPPDIRATRVHDCVNISVDYSRPRPPEPPARPTLKERLDEQAAEGETFLRIGGDDSWADKAFVGIGSRCGFPDVLVYDYEALVAACAEHLECEDDDSEAREFVDYNIVHAYLGDDTPILLHHLPEPADKEGAT